MNKIYLFIVIIIVILSWKTVFSPSQWSFTNPFNVTQGQLK